MERLAAAHGVVDRVATMALEQLAGGGKRLRARLALAAAETLGAERGAVSWAAAVELLHNATLVHDDVQDGDRMRRGRPSLWVRHGVAQALNAGNFLLMLPYAALAEMPAEHRGPLAHVLADHAIATVRGQVAELELLPSERTDWSSWTEAAAGKTGAMFALPIVGAALLAGRSLEAATALGEPFRDLGVLFQIYDDVLDLYGDKGRETAGSDLYEGKVSALVVEHLVRRPSDRRWLLELLRTPREATSRSAVIRASDAFVSSGALAGVIARLEATAGRVLGAAALANNPACPPWQASSLPQAQRSRPIGWRASR